MNSRTIYLISLLVFVLLVNMLPALHVSVVTNDPQLHTCLIMAASLAVVILLLWLVIGVFGQTEFKEGFLNFFIGDEGGYSLSRIQAVFWAIIIIAFQVAEATALAVNPHGNYVHLYEPVFSESSLWLIGLSLSSYIAVKGITVSQIKNSPAKYVRGTKNPSWKDLLSGDNGLDFSRCQVLIWTLIAMAVYLVKCYYFLNYLLVHELGHPGNLFTPAVDPVPTADPSGRPPVPYLPWSFIVLMGISQGSYIGKKLIPTAKLEDLKEEKRTAIRQQAAELSIKKQLLERMSILPDSKTLTDTDKKNIKNIREEIAATQRLLEDFSGEIRQIDKALGDSRS